MDRREFLQTSGLVAATAAYGASESPAIAGSNAPNSPIRVAQLKSPPPVTALDAPSVRKLLDAVAPLQPGAPGDTSDIPEILQPIDVGADALLTPFKNAALTYSPMEVEYLVNTLDDHITNCLNLREKAQQLEVLAVAQRLELRMEQKVIEFLTALAEFEKTNAPHVAASMFDPMVSGGQVSGSSSPEAIKFYDDRHSLEDIALQARREIAGARLSEMRRDGSGNHYVQRFNFIKESFIHQRVF